MLTKECSTLSATWACGFSLRKLFTKSFTFDTGVLTKSITEFANLVSEILKADNKRKNVMKPAPNAFVLGIFGEYFRISPIVRYLTDMAPSMNVVMAITVENDKNMSPCAIIPPWPATALLVKDNTVAIAIRAVGTVIFLPPYFTNSAVTRINPPMIPVTSIKLFSAINIGVDKGVTLSFAAANAPIAANTALTCVIELS